MGQPLQFLKVWCAALLSLWLFAFSTPLFALDGDVNHDGKVDLTDLSLVRTHFGQTTSEGDANGDGKVDLTDLNLVRSNFGAQEPPGPQLLGDANRDGVVDLNDMNLAEKEKRKTSNKQTVAILAWVMGKNNL